MTPKSCQPRIAVYRNFGCLHPVRFFVHYPLGGKHRADCHARHPAKLVSPKAARLNQSNVFFFKLEDYSGNKDKVAQPQIPGTLSSINKLQLDTTT